MDYVAISRAGISMQVFHRILKFSQISTKEIATMLPVSERQLSRYSPDHILRKDISSHLIQIVELFQRGYEVFGVEKFQLWIRSENRALGNIPPIDILDTPIGIKMVEDIIGRIEHGVYS